MTQEPSPAASSGPAPGDADRLDSWKEVAAYLKRDVTTAQRWERREGLPVHRHLHDKLGSVYTFQSELDAWQKARTLQSGQAGCFQGMSLNHRAQAQQARACRHFRRLNDQQFRRVGGSVVSQSSSCCLGSWRPLSRSASHEAADRRPRRQSHRSLSFRSTTSANPAHAYLAAGLTGTHHPARADPNASRGLADVGHGVGGPSRGTSHDRARAQVDAALAGSVRYQDGRVRFPFS